MTVTLCMAKDGGMLFNNRRISRDRAVISDIEENIGDGVLFVSEFSVKLFKDSPLSVIAVTDPLESAGKEDTVFIENISLTPYINKTDKLIIYKWEENYPSDFKFDISPKKSNMTLASSVEFVGAAHEKITKETWIK